MCVCVCVCVFIHTHTYIYKQVYIFIFILTNMHVCIAFLFSMNAQVTKENTGKMVQVLVMRFILYYCNVWNSVILKNYKNFVLKIHGSNYFRP